MFSTTPIKIQKFQASPGHPTIQFNSNYLELVQTLQVKGSVPQDFHLFYVPVPSLRPPVLLTVCINQGCPQPHPWAAQFAGIIHRIQKNLDLLVPVYYKGYDKRHQ